jgi:hypothetical protein
MNLVLQSSLVIRGFGIKSRKNEFYFNIKINCCFCNSPVRIALQLDIAAENEDILDLQ